MLNKGKQKVKTGEISAMAAFVAMKPEAQNSKTANWLTKQAKKGK